MSNKSKSLASDLLLILEELKTIQDLITMETQDVDFLKVIHINGNERFREWMKFQESRANLFGEIDFKIITDLVN